MRKPPIEVVEDHKSSANFPIALGMQKYNQSKIRYLFLQTRFLLSNKFTMDVRDLVPMIDVQHIFVEYIFLKF